MRHLFRVGTILAVVLSLSSPLRAQAQPERLTAAGRLIPARQVILRAMTDSIVVEVNAEAGKRVEAGQFLLRLDTRDLELSIERAEAQLEAAKVDLDLARLQVDAAETELKQTTLISEQARSNPAATTFEKTMTQLDVSRAKAQVESTKLRYRQAQAQQKAAEVEVRAAKLAHHRATITAPFSGVIAHVEAELGQVVRAGDTALLHLIDTRLLAEARVPAAVATKVKPGARASLRVNGDDVTIAGEVVTVLPLIDGKDNTVPVRIRLPEIDENGPTLRAGAAVTVAIEAAAGE